jgi:hypothetical protein
MPTQEDIPHSDYRAGFIVGFQAVAKTSRSIPSIPSQPSTPSGLRPFLVGVRKGIEKATGKDWDQIDG